MTDINFEQLCEEARATFPAARVISACERPLSLVADGIPQETAGLLAAHVPCHLRLGKPAIRPDGVDAALLVVDCPALAGGTLALMLIHGTTSLQEQVDLDAHGHGELEVASTTPGEICIRVEDKPVRVTLTVKEEQ